jgi:segregation and condensation protein A
MAHVKLAQFEGPLELLLELITAKKMEISQIALAEVTDQYLNTIADIETVAPGELADFLVVASTLLLIKSRTLLPAFAVSEEEEHAMLSLEDRLREYQRYRGAGKVLKSLFERNAQVFTRTLWQGFPGGFFLPQNPPTANDLAARLRRLKEELEAFFAPRETKVIARIMSIEEKIKEILGRIEKEASMTFTDLSGERSKAELILAFLALLFLFRQKTIMLSQEAKFGPIVVQKIK